MERDPEGLTAASSVGLGRSSLLRPGAPPGLMDALSLPLLPDGLRPQEPPGRPRDDRRLGRPRLREPLRAGAALRAGGGAPVRGGHGPDRPQPRGPRPGAGHEHPRPVDLAHLAELVLEPRHGAVLHQRRRPLHAEDVRPAARAGRGRDPLGQAARGPGRLAARPLPTGAGGAPARPRPAAHHAARPLRLQPVERQPAGHDALRAGHQHHPRVHQPALHLPRAQLRVLAGGRAARAALGGPAVGGSTPAASTRPARWASSSWSSACSRCWWSSRRSSARTSTSPCRPSGWAAGHSPATSHASSWAAATSRAWASASPRRRTGRPYPVGRDGVFEAFTPAVLRRHARGGGPLHGGQVGVVRGRRAQAVPRARQGGRRGAAPPRGHRRAGEAVLPVRLRDLRPLPGVPRPDVPAPDRPGRSTPTRTSTSASIRRAPSPSSTWSTSAAGTPISRDRTAGRPGATPDPARRGGGAGSSTGWRPPRRSAPPGARRRPRRVGSLLGDRGPPAGTSAVRQGIRPKANTVSTPRPMPITSKQAPITMAKRATCWAK